MLWVAMDLEPAGQGRLEFERCGEKTVLRSVYARAPLRFLTPKNSGDAAWVYSSSLGGGLVGGDALRIGIRVGPGARGVLLSQSSNKVYRSERETSQTLDVRLAQGSSLISMPDPTVCFEGARFSQVQTFELESDASLLLVDAFHCGRSASGERWLFERLQNRIEIRRQSKPIFLESLLLDSRAGALAGRMGRFDVVALAVLTGPAWTAPARRLLAELGSEPLGVRADCLVAASPLGEDGVLLRLASVSAEGASWALRRYLSFVPERLGDNPWARKG